MPRWPGFIGGSDTPQSLIADSERTVNLYVEPLTASAKNVAMLCPTPGFLAWATVPDVSARGAIVANGRLIVVIGASVYEYSSIGGWVKLGTVLQDSNPALIVYNGVVGNQVGIVSGGTVYCLDLVTNMVSATILTGGFTHLAYADGYGLAFNPTTGTVYLSSLNDLSTYNLGVFFRRSKFPDPWQAMWVDPNGLIWLVGTETFEVWSNANPASTQPWAPLSGLTGRTGIAAPFAYAVSGVGMTWLATTKEGGLDIVLTTGGLPATMSSYAVANALATYQEAGSVANTEALIYRGQGHTFAVYSFPLANATWCVDLQTKSWTERGRWNAPLARYDLWSPRMVVSAFNKQLIGDRTTGQLSIMSPSYRTEIDGSLIRRLRRSPGLTNELKRQPIDQVQLLMDVGVAGQNIDPLATMRISQDGGRTFGNERQCSFGRTGAYGQRVYWTQCGAPADAVMEVVWTADAPVRVVDAYVNNAEQAA